MESLSFALFWSPSLCRMQDIGDFGLIGCRCAKRWASTGGRRAKCGVDDRCRVWKHQAGILLVHNPHAKPFCRRVACRPQKKSVDEARVDRSTLVFPHATPVVDTAFGALTTCRRPTFGASTADQTKISDILYAAKRGTPKQSE